MIFDAHMHLGLLPNYYLPDHSPESIIELMNHLGIDYGMQMNMSGFTHMPDYAYETSVKVYDLSRKRIFFGLIFDPNNPKESMRWIKKSMAEEGCVCIKLHPSWHNTYADDQAYDEIWRFADEHGKPLVTHTWSKSDYNPTQKFSTPDLFVKFLEKYPGVNLVMGHGGGRYEGHLLAIEIAKKFPNVYLDTSGDVNTYGLLKMQVEKIGSSRILFGSDINMMDPRNILGKIFAADISLHDKEMILGANAARLFGLEI